MAQAPKVYVLNKGPYDYSDAERFGELVYCTEGRIDKMDVAQMYRELEDAMRASDPDDYILLTSLTSLCSIGCAMFTHRHARLNLLIHYNSEYVSKKIIFTNDEDDRGNRK